MERTATEGSTLASALAAAQADLSPGIAKNAKGNFGKYSDLGAHLEAIHPVAAKHGLAIVQGAQLVNDSWVLATTLYHGPSGETLTTYVPLLTDAGRNTPMQALGSAITYARRYADAGLFNLAAEDDDGQSSGIDRTPARSQPAPRPAAPKQRPTTRDDFGQREPRLVLKPGKPVTSQPPQPPPLGDDDIPF